MKYPWKHCLLCGRIGHLNHGLCLPCFSDIETELFSNYAFGQCRTCGSPILHEDGICCGSNQSRSSQIWRLGPYSGYLKEIILKYKYHSCRNLSNYLASLMRPTIESMIGIFGNIWVIPVPCSQKGKISRGWDQMQVIAKILGLISGVTYHDVLIRIGKGEQKILGRQERIEKSIGKYQLRSPRRADLKPNENLPMAVVLLDDVYTTGATIQECIGLIKTRFSCPVTGICLAMD